jgi:hypothetical protein
MTNRSSTRKRMRKVIVQLPRLLVVMALMTALGALLVPALDQQVARTEAEELGRQVESSLAGARPGAVTVGRDDVACSSDWLWKMPARGSELASWANVGGCGAGGGTSTAGGFKWIGRGVTGGLIDVQCMGSQNVYLDGTTSLSFTTRLGTHIGYKWMVAVNVPFLYNVETVTAFGVEKEAHLPGFGDLSFEVTRKLGITNAHSLTLGLTAPIGAHDAVRKGVILPQRQQLGTGVMAASLTYEYTMDFDWGLMIFGGTLAYGGWENSVGDFRAPSASGYLHVGYMLGPLVPSAGLNITGRFMSDRERNVEISNVREMFTISPSVGLEWSSDYLAVMLSLTTPLSFQRMDSWMVGLGIQTSLF